MKFILVINKVETSRYIIIIFCGLVWLYVYFFLQYLKIPADTEREENYEIQEENIRSNPYNNQVRYLIQKFHIIYLYRMNTNALLCILYCC